MGGHSVIHHLERSYLGSAQEKIFLDLGSEQEKIFLDVGSEQEKIFLDLG